MKKIIACLLVCTMVISNLNGTVWAASNTVSGEVRTATASNAQKEETNEGPLEYGGELASSSDAQTVRKKKVNFNIESPVFELKKAGVARNDYNKQKSSFVARYRADWTDTALYRAQLPVIESMLAVTGIQEIYDKIEDRRDMLTIELGELASFESTEYYETSDEVKEMLQNIYKECGNKLQIANDAFTYDHPEIFWEKGANYQFKTNIKNNDDFSGFVYTVKGSMTYKTDLTEQEINIMADKQENAIEDILSLTANEDGRYQILMAFHDFLVDSVSYDYSLKGQYSHEAFGALVENYDDAGKVQGKSAVCEGYAKAFKILCDRMDIPCVLVVGDAGTGSSRAAHMWNYVQMDDKNWYAVDVTWDDQVTITVYDYFLVGRKTVGFHNSSFKESHKEKGTFSTGGWEFDYPDIQEEAYKKEEPAVQIWFDNDELSMKLGETQRLTVNQSPVEAATILIWNSSNPEVLSVDSEGIATAVGEGSARITARTTEGAKAVCYIMVVIPVTGITLQQYQIEIVGMGSQVRLVPEIQPLNATNQKLVWYSSDSDVVEVDSAGTLTAVNQGEATVSVTTEDGGFAAVCKVKVMLSREERIREYVISIYTHISGKKPEIKVLDAWCRQLKEKQISCSDLICALVFNPAYEARYVTDEEFVEIIYQAVLQRAADEAGSSNYLEYLSNGVSRAYIIKRITDSREFGRLCDNYDIISGTVFLEENRDRSILVTGFVSRCYQTILDRKPDVAGLNNWTGRLLEKTISGAEMVDYFLSSKEFQNRRENDVESVAILYHSMMGREADPEGKEKWLEVLNQGVSLRYLIKRFAESSEFIRLCNRYNIIPGTIRLEDNRNQNLQITGFVSKCYLEALGRKADVEGLEYWTGQILRNKVTAKQVAERFVFSMEVENKKLSDMEFVKLLYRTCFGRQAEAEGLNTWSYRLNHGYSRKSAFLAFVDSKEFKIVMEKYGLKK